MSPPANQTTESDTEYYISHSIGSKFLCWTKRMEGAWRMEDRLSLYFPIREYQREVKGTSSLYLSIREYRREVKGTSSLYFPIREYQREVKVTSSLYFSIREYQREVKGTSALYCPIREYQREWRVCRLCIVPSERSEGCFVIELIILGGWKISVETLLNGGLIGHLITHSPFW